MTTGSTTRGGWGWPHQQERARIKPTVDAGNGYCTEPVCLYADRWIDPSEPWDLAHDRDNGGYHGPAHAKCNRSEGATYRNQGGRHDVEFLSNRTPLTPLRTLPHTHGEGDEPRFSGVALRPELLWAAHIESAPAWLAPYLDVPEDAAPPLAMTPVHERAVGSYGPAAIEWLEESAGIVLRWWQRLAIVRQLEHDAEGALCWTVTVESASRRVGKSVRLRGGALWRLEHAHLFGEPQLAIHTGKDLAIVREIQRKAWTWAGARGWRVVKAIGRESIENGDHRWLARSIDAVYGYDVTLGMVDEGWAVDGATVSDGLEPAALERSSPQIVLTSTAHRRATGLMRTRIKDALVVDDGETLLLLWSVPDGADMGLLATWRAASAHWSPARARMIASKYAKASAGQQDEEFDDPDPMAGFASQYLNRWQLGTVRPDTVIDPELWAACAGIAERIGEPSYAVDVESGLLSASIASAGAAEGGRCWVDVERHEGIEWVAGRLAELGIGTVAMVARGASAALATALEDAGVLVMLLDNGAAIQACGTFQGDVLAGRIVNPDWPVLNDAVAAAQKRDVGDQGGWVFGRKKSGRDISALEACAWAKWLHDKGLHYDVMESFL